MSNSIYHHPISIPFDIKHPQLSPPEEGRLMANRRYDIVDKRLLSFIDSCDAYFVFNEYFVFTPGSTLRIHVDEPTLTRSICKLILFMGDGGLVNWYDPLPEFKNKEGRLFFDQEVTLAHQEHMIGDYIVNVGIPHNFYNNTDSLSYVAGFLLFDKHTNTFLTFEDGVERFSKYARQPVAQKTTSDNIIQNTFDKSKEIE